MCVLQLLVLKEENTALKTRVNELEVELEASKSGDNKPKNAIEAARLTDAIVNGEAPPEGEA